MLSNHARERFHEDGFLVEAGHLRPERLRDLQAELARILDAAGERSQSDERYDLASDHGPGRVRCRRVKEPYRFSAIFDGLLRAPEILDVVQSLLGESIYFTDMPLNIKPASHESGEIGWHQDWAFEPLTNDSALTVTVALCDCTRENGALQVVAGTHRADPIYAHSRDGVFTGAVDPADRAVPWERATLVEVPAGTITLHHARTLHGSGANRTGRDRPVQAIGLCAGDAWPRDHHDGERERLSKRCLRGAIGAPRWDEAVPIHPAHRRAARTGSLFELQRASEFALMKS